MHVISPIGNMPQQWIISIQSPEAEKMNLYPAGDYREWDGLTIQLLQLVEQDETLLQDSFIAKWYKVSKPNKNSKEK